jgi:hypothetical protein
LIGMYMEFMDAPLAMDLLEWLLVLVDRPATAYFFS